MKPDATLIQITDTHLNASNEPIHGVIDTASQLGRIADAIRSARVSPAAIVHTGDASDDGSPESYRALCETLNPLAKGLGAPLIHLPGNHDDPATYAEAVGVASFDQTYDVEPIRIVTLDSTRPGETDGELSDDQLRWLSAQYADAPDGGVVVALHHPPLRQPVTLMDVLRLKNADYFVEALDPQVVRAVLTGHSHTIGAAALRGIPVWIGMPASYSLDPAPPSGTVSARGRFGFSRVDFYGDQVLMTAVPVDDSTVVYRRAEIAFSGLFSRYGDN